MARSDRLLKNHAAMTAATGLSSYDLSSIRRAAAETDDNPFTGRWSSERRLLGWIERHPDFKPSTVWKRRPEPQDTDRDRPLGASDRSDGRSPKSGQQNALPEPLARPHGQAA